MRLTKYTPRFVLMLVFGCLVAPVSTAQSISRIGDYLHWSEHVHIMPMDITVDGSRAAFIESWGDGCGGTVLQRLSSIRSDGTDYLVHVPHKAMKQLKPNLESTCQALTMSGDGRWIAFVLDDAWSCTLGGPWEWYLLDTATNAVQHLQWNGFRVGWVSFTDDGGTLAFKGWDPVLGWGFYLASPSDPGAAVRFLDASAWFAAGGTISGGGTHFVFFGSQNSVCPCPAELFSFEFATAIQTTLTPAPTPLGLGSFDVAADGQRVVYSTGPVYGVLTDGTQHHQISNVWGSWLTSSTDGAWVVYWSDGLSYRQPWVGGPELTFPAYTQSNASPSNADASIMPRIFAGDATFEYPLCVWFEHTPVLTTYGYGLPDTPLTWDVGGSPGDTFLLLYSFGPAALPLKTWGTLGLDPATLGVVAAGVVGGPPQNIGQVQVQLGDELLVTGASGVAAVPGTPYTVRVAADLEVLGPFDVWFQALVTSPEGKRLTNTTRFTFGLPDPDPHSSSFAATAAPRAGEGARQHCLPSAEDSETAWLRLRNSDPAVWMAGYGVPLPVREQ